MRKRAQSPWSVIEMRTLHLAFQAPPAPTPAAPASPAASSSQTPCCRVPNAPSSLTAWPLSLAPEPLQAGPRYFSRCVLRVFIHVSPLIPRGAALPSAPVPRAPTPMLSKSAHPSRLLRSSHEVISKRPGREGSRRSEFTPVSPSTPACPWPRMLALVRASCEHSPRSCQDLVVLRRGCPDALPKDR